MDTDLDEDEREMRKDKDYSSANSRKCSGVEESLASKTTDCTKSNYIPRYSLTKNHELMSMSMKLVISVLQRNHEIQNMLIWSMCAL
jgi:hypothetical protein